MLNNFEQLLKSFFKTVNVLFIFILCGLQAQIKLNHYCEKDTCLLECLTFKVISIHVGLRKSVHGRIVVIEAQNSRKLK